MSREYTHVLPRVGLALALVLSLAGCQNGFLGIGGKNNDPLDGKNFIAASAFESTADPSQSKIIVRWDVPSRPQASPQRYSSYIVAYEVYRSTSPNFSPTPEKLVEVMVGGNINQFIDSNVSSGVVRTLTLTTNDTGYVTSSVTTEADDGTIPASLTFAEDETEYVVPSNPLQSGQTYYYAVRTVIKDLTPSPFEPQDTSGSGGGGGGSSTTTQALAGLLVVGETPIYTGPATAVERPELISPPNYPQPGSQDVDLTNAQFQWMTVPGADTYVIEMSMDREFDAKQILLSRDIAVNDTNGGLQVARPFEGGGFSSFQGYDGEIFWRIGARRQADRYRPVDVTTNKTINWVYSEPSSFQAQTEPPLPPG